MSSCIAMLHVILIREKKKKKKKEIEQSKINTLRKRIELIYVLESIGNGFGRKFMVLLEISWLESLWVCY